MSTKFDGKKYISYRCSINKHSRDIKVGGKRNLAWLHILLPFSHQHVTEFLVERTRVGQKSCAQQHVSNQPVKRIQLFDIFEKLNTFEEDVNSVPLYVTQRRDRDRDKTGLLMSPWYGINLIVRGRRELLYLPICASNSLLCSVHLSFSPPNPPIRVEAANIFRRHVSASSRRSCKYSR